MQVPQVHRIVRYLKLRSSLRLRLTSLEFDYSNHMTGEKYNIDSFCDTRNIELQRNPPACFCIVGNRVEQEIQNLFSRPPSRPLLGSHIEPILYCSAGQVLKQLLKVGAPKIREA
jgi:hypothetical protein